jgi:hypothetical protein
MINLDRGVEVEMPNPFRITLVVPEPTLLSRIIMALRADYAFQFTSPTRCLDGKWAVFGRRQLGRAANIPAARPLFIQQENDDGQRYPEL